MKPARANTTDSPIGRRVVAWRGDRADQFGTVTRVDGIYHSYIRWDDGDETHYENAALTRPEFYHQPGHRP